MFWSKKKKTKEEIINIEEETVEEIIEEKKEEVKSIEEIKQDINDQFQYIKKNWDEFYHNFLICRFLIKINLRPSQSSEQITLLENRINDLQVMISSLKEKLNEISDDKIIDLGKETLDVYSYMRGMETQLKESYANFSEMKISSAHIFMNKNTEELEKLYQNIEIEGKDYSNFSQAADAIYYYSGDFLTSLINQLVSLISSTKQEKYINSYPFSFFLPSEVVVTLSIKEWIDLYNHIKFSLKNFPGKKDKKYQEFMKQLDRFEAIYTILMIRAENQTTKYA